MSRSRRKTNICGITMAASEKADKQKANRAERHKVKSAMVSSGEIEVLPTKRETSDVWSMAKDGKIYFDASKNPKLMRK
jgi:hypothetical protein